MELFIYHYSTRIKIWSWKKIKVRMLLTEKEKDDHISNAQRGNYHTAKNNQWEYNLLYMLNISNQGRCI